MNTEDVIDFINSPDPDLTVDEKIQLKKKSTVEEIDHNFESVM